MNLIEGTLAISQRKKIWKIAGLILILFLVNRYFGTNAVFIAAGGVTLAIVLFLRQNAAEYSVYALALWFAAGYRAFNLGSYTLHMLDLIPLLLVFLWLRGDIPHRDAGLRPAYLRRLRYIRLGIVILSFYGMVFVVGNNVPMPQALLTMKNFLLLVPLLIMLPRILQLEHMTRNLMWILLIVGLIIAVPGILEFHIGIFAEGSSWSDGFNRALFSFWGATMAVLVLTLCFQAHWYLWGDAHDNKTRVLILASATIQLYSIYISGTRNMWIATLTMVVLAVYMRLGAWKALFVLPLSLFVLLSYAPEAGVKRMESFYFLHETDQFGRSDTRWLDSSGAERAARMQGAVDAMIENPFGRGWSSSGWVHSDILSIGADLGVLPALIFVFLLLSSTARVILRARRTSGPDQWRWLTYTGFMVTNVLLFSFGGVTWLIQYAMPAWFCWILAEYHLYHEPVRAEN